MEAPVDQVPLKSRQRPEHRLQHANLVQHDQHVPKDQLVAEVALSNYHTRLSINLV